MGSIFRRANRAEIVRYAYPDSDDWIEMRAELTKGEVNKLILATPKGSEDVEGSLGFIQRFATIAVTGWSAVDENDKPVAFSMEEYLELPGDIAQWLDKIFSEHLQKIMGAEVEELEGKP